MGTMGSGDMDSGTWRRNIFSLKLGSIPTDRCCRPSGRANLKSSFERNFLADMVPSVRWIAVGMEDKAVERQ